MLIKLKHDTATLYGLLLKAIGRIFGCLQQKKSNNNKSPMSFAENSKKMSVS